MLNWANRFNICCFLDDHDYRQRGNRFDCILAADTLESMQVAAGNAFQSLLHFRDRHSDWLFGHLSFELKEETEGVASKQSGSIGFPDMHFFVPRYVVQLSAFTLTIGTTAEDHEAVFNDIVHSVPSTGKKQHQQPLIRARQTKEQYIDAVNALKQHILRGDCYELNYCQEFFCDQYAIYPLDLFASLQAVSPAPFSAYYR